MSLANFGWEKYRESLRYQIALGNEFKSKLERIGMEVLNDSPLPVFCFRPKQQTGSDDDLNSIQKRLASAGIWITTVRIGDAKTLALRVGINHAGANSTSLDRLVSELRCIISASGRIG